MRWLTTVTVRHASAVAVFGSLLLHAFVLCVLGLYGTPSPAGTLQARQYEVQPIIEVALWEAPTGQAQAPSTEHLLARAIAGHQGRREPVQPKDQTRPAAPLGSSAPDQHTMVAAAPTPAAPAAAGVSPQRQTDVALSTAGAPSTERQPDHPMVQSARPDYAYNPQPDYPMLLREHGIGGVVWLRVWVESDGRPADIQVTKGSGYRLMDESALRAVKQWRFVPALHGTQHVASWVEFPIRFTLNS